MRVRGAGAGCGKITKIPGPDFAGKNIQDRGKPFGTLCIRGE